jgi:GntR family transcriptional repressor for pyruvate dehydrogenase complex
LFDLLKRNVVTNIGGMYQQRTETRDMLISQHRELYLAIVEGVRRMRGRFPAGTFCMCRRCWKRRRKRQRVARAERRSGR